MLVSNYWKQLKQDKHQICQWKNYNFNSFAYPYYILMTLSHDIMTMTLMTFNERFDPLKYLIAIFKMCIIQRNPIKLRIQSILRHQNL